MNANKIIWKTVIPLSFIFFGCEQKPVLTSINPNHVVARQIVAVEGSNLGWTDVLWNAGGSAQELANTGLFSAHYFQVPVDAEIGSHAVQLRNSAGSSITYVLDVDPLSGRWPAPRVEDITVNNFNINDDKTSASAWLMLAVANVDTKAVVTVNGTVLPSYLYSAIPSDYFPLSHTASTYFYPVYDYGQLIVPVTLPPGTVLDIRVTNTDGRSAVGSYTLAKDMASLDSDGDGLLDDWEINGYKGADGRILSLAGFGCDPHKKDILVEVDWVAAAAPNPSIWSNIEDSFADAPVLNPDGSQGIAIHIDRGQNGIFDKGGTILSPHSFIGFGGNPTTPGYRDFYSYKSNSENFDPLRKDVFHYCIFGVAQTSGASGVAELWGNDFIVSFTLFSNWGKAGDEAGTFMHELGHNLNLHHGGIAGLLDQDETFKVNQPSSMNYRYQFAGTPFNCSIVPGGIYTYSIGMLNPINEQAVVEATGICDNAGIDYDMNGIISSLPQVMNLNPSIADADFTDVDFNYDEWGNIQLNFRLTGSLWLNN